MECTGDTKKSITLGLKPNEEESRLEVLTICEQIITQTIERVGRTISPIKQEPTYTLETDSEKEFEQLPPMPDMSPIIRPVMLPMGSLPYFPISETKPSVVLDKTQDIIIELLIKSMGIFSAQEESSQNGEKYLINLKQNFGKKSKGNKFEGSIQR